MTNQLVGNLKIRNKQPLRISCLKTVCAVLPLILFLFFLFFLVLVGFVAEQSCFADPKSANNVQIDVDENYADAARFLLTTKNVLEGTVGVSFEVLDNAKGSQPLPLSFIIDKPYNRFEFLRIVRADTNRPWHYTWHYKYKNGLPSSKQTVDYVYSLPYTGKKHSVTQSYLGAHSHFLGSETEYAVDFEMPEGTTVRAARAGKVIALRDDSTRHGDSPDFKYDANEIAIKHDDGTYGSYVHLKYRGVLVKLGQQVAEGDPIGLSGSTGWSTRPHLHFGVFRVISADKQQSLPFQMRTARGVLKQLEVGQSY